MARIIQHSGKNIQFVSDTNANLVGDNILTLSDKKYNDISDGELLENYVVWNGNVFHKSDSLNFKDIKIAFISNYRSSCGISTYAEKLYNSIIPYVKEYRIFAEIDETNQTDEPNVIRCWKRGKPVDTLIEKINEFKPDVILIQHEYGLFPDLRVWLSLMTQLQHLYQVYVVLHSVYANHADKTICELVINNIIVHTDSSFEILRKKKLQSNLYCIPHGCDDFIIRDKPWNFYKTEHSVIQFGFGFRYKGWENSLKVIKELKDEYQDIFFTGVFSESPSNKNLHQQYFDELMQLVKDYQIENNVGFIRGFIDDELLTNVLTTNRIALFPYIDNGVHQVYACSGAARVALTAQLPTIVSQVPLFDDLETVCPRCSSVEDIKQQLIKFWNDKNLYKEQVEKQNEFLKKNSWSSVAKQFLELFSKVN